MADVKWVPVGTVSSTPQASGNPNSLVIFNGATGYIITASNVQLLDNIFTATNQDADLIFKPDGTGVVQSPSSFQTGDKLIMLDDAGTESVSLQAPSTLTSSYLLTMPTSDGFLGEVLATDGAGNLYWANIMSGFVTGPVTSTNHGIARWNGTAGVVLDDSGVIIDDFNNVTGAVSAVIGNISIAVNTISALNTDGDLIFSPNGTGIVLSNSSVKSKISFILEDPGVGVNTITFQAPTLFGDYVLTFPTSDGLSGQILTTDGTGVLSWTSNGNGNVNGPVSSTDNALVRWDGITGQLIKDSNVLLDSFNNLTNINDLSAIGIITTKNSFVMEDPGIGTNTITIKAPTLSASYTLTFPVDTGTPGQVLITDGSGVLSWFSAATGDVIGPGSSTDNALVRFDGTTGKLIQNSIVILADTGELSGLTQLDVDNLELNGNTISSTDTNGNIIFSPNGTGITTSAKAIKSQTSFILEDPGAGTNVVNLVAPTLGGDWTFTFPTGGGTNNYVLTTNGSGVTSWAANPMGAIIGPASSTDTAIILFDGTTGKLAKNSVVTITTGGIIDTTGAQINFSGTPVLKTIVADFNVSVGQLAMPSPTASSGIQDTAIGYNALHALTTSVGSVGVGYNAGALITTGNHNTLIGNAAGAALTTQAGNTFVGYNTGLIATSAQNTMVGDQAGAAHTSGTGATYIGWKAGNAISTSNNNTMLGNSAGLLTTGANNTYVGNSAGATGTSGNNNTVIGNAADVGATNTYSIVLGSGAVANGSNQFVVGSSTAGQGVTTTTTGGTTNGTATALTLLPLGYWTVKLNGTNVNIPYYSLT